MFFNKIIWTNSHYLSFILCITSLHDYIPNMMWVLTESLATWYNWVTQPKLVSTSLSFGSVQVKNLCLKELNVHHFLNSNSSTIMSIQCWIVSYLIYSSNLSIFSYLLNKFGKIMIIYKSILVYMYQWLPYLSMDSTHFIEFGWSVIWVSTAGSHFTIIATRFRLNDYD